MNIGEIQQMHQIVYNTQRQSPVVFERLGFFNIHCLHPFSCSTIEHVNVRLTINY